MCSGYENPTLSGISEFPCRTRGTGMPSHKPWGMLRRLGGTSYPLGGALYISQLKPIGWIKDETDQTSTSIELNKNLHQWQGLFCLTIVAGMGWKSTKIQRSGFSAFWRVFLGGAWQPLAYQKPELRSKLPLPAAPCPVFGTVVTTIKLARYLMCFTPRKEKLQDRLGFAECLFSQGPTFHANFVMWHF